MTPEGGLFLALVIVITVCGIFTSCVCCMCCCVSSLWNAVVQQFFGKARSAKPNYNSISTSLVHSSASYHSEAVAVEETALCSEDVPLVEAYIIPPLANHSASCSTAEALVVGAPSVIVNSDLSNGEQRPAVTLGAKDLWAAVLFSVNIIVIFSLAVQSIALFNSTSFNGGSDPLDMGKSGLNFPMLALYLTLTLLSISLLGSYAIYFLLHNGERIIDWVMKGNVLGLFVFAAISLISLNIFGAVILGIMAGVNLWYYYSARSRIPFASGVLSAACTAIRANFTGLLMTSFAGLLFQGLWMLLWSIALCGVMLRLKQDSSSTTSSSSSNGGDDDQSDGLSTFVTLLLLFSLYWGLQLIKDVVAVTASGTVATWWFQPTHRAPVRGSLFRATTTSFGSICFGSMILAVITTARSFLRGIVDKMNRSNRRGQDRNILLQCLLIVLQSLLKMLENVIQYINRYAYAYVAAYGYDFFTAGKSVLHLFERRGWSTIINDDLISNALFLLAILMGIAGAGLGLLWTLLLSVTHSDVLGDVDVSTAYVLGGVFGGLVGLVVGLLIVSLLDSAVAMVYVCFAEDSATLHRLHPETFDILQAAWSKFNNPDVEAVSNDVSVALSPIHQYPSNVNATAAPASRPGHPSPFNPHYVPQDSYAPYQVPMHQNKEISGVEVASISRPPASMPGSFSSTTLRPPPLNPSYRANNNKDTW